MIPTWRKAAVPLFASHSIQGIAVALTRLKVSSLSLTRPDFSTARGPAKRVPGMGARQTPRSLRSGADGAGDVQASLGCGAGGVGGVRFGAGSPLRRAAG